MKKILLIFPMLALISCSSTNMEIKKVVQSNIGEEKVLSRIDGLSSRPNWLRESEPFVIDNGRVFSLGQSQGPIDGNLTALYRIAENNSKASISSAIESRLDFVFQNAEEGLDLNATQARFIGAEASKLTTSSIRVSKRYYEKVATIQSEGNATTQYKVFVLSEMPEADFKKAVLDAIRRSEGKKGISKDFSEKVEKHWDSFTSKNDASE